MGWSCRWNVWRYWNDGRLFELAQHIIVVVQCFCVFMGSQVITNFLNVMTTLSASSLLSEKLMVLIPHQLSLPAEALSKRGSQLHIRATRAKPPTVHRHRAFLFPKAVCVSWASRFWNFSKGIARKFTSLLEVVSPRTEMATPVPRRPEINAETVTVSSGLFFVRLDALCEFICASSPWVWILLIWLTWLGRLRA